MKLLRLQILLASLVAVVLPVRLIAGDTSISGLEGDLFPSLLKLLGAMLLILVLIYGSVWLMKKYSLAKMSSSSDLISIIERRYLNAKQAVFLLKVGDKHLLVGSSESGINLISDIDLTKDTPSDPVSVKARQGSKFSQLLKQAKGSIISSMKVKVNQAELEG